jgi:methylenetetrahydrofolate--tRNA-(uracil-5-)-methyltransferase
MMRDPMADVIVVGGGLAGSEAAWQAAERGISVALYEMRPGKMTGAHVGPGLAELVCSNSLGSNMVDRSSGLLKEELRRMGSLLIRCADEAAVPAGSALAVDREVFSRYVTQALESHPNIRIYRREVTSIPDGQPVIIASGPLTSPALSLELQRLTGHNHLYFFDAIAPIVYADSINMEVAYQASRYGRGELVDGDYINCPLDKDEYDRFHQALLEAQRIELKSFELELERGIRAGAHRYFEGCLPVEIIARRGEKSLAFGPLRPVGLVNPYTGKRPYAVVQLRQDNLARTLYNLVGFQTNLTYPEQKRVFRMIPGLESARFARFGQMHRNTFIYSPAVLEPTLRTKFRGSLFFAGQMTGVEGYVGNIGTGLLAGWNVARLIKNKELVELPETTMLGALCRYITQASPIDFQPMKANFGILPPITTTRRTGKKERGEAYAKRSLQDLATLIDSMDEGKFSEPGI